MKGKTIAARMCLGLTSTAARVAAMIAGAATMPVVLGVLIAPAMAMEIAGIKLAEKIALGKGGPQLVLE